jgi:hypothetical protein
MFLLLLLLQPASQPTTTFNQICLNFGGIVQQD